MSSGGGVGSECWIDIILHKMFDCRINFLKGLCTRVTKLKQPASPLAYSSSINHGGYPPSIPALPWVGELEA